MKPWIAVLWSGVYFILLLSFLTPLVVITISLFILPPLVLYGTLGLYRSLPYIIAPIILLLLIFQAYAIPMLFLWAFFVIPAIVMGELYRRDSSARKVFAAGALVIVGELLLALLLSYAFQYDVAAEMRAMMWDNYHNFPSVIKTEIPQDLMEMSIQMVIQMIPTFMIAMGVYYAAISHTLGHRMLQYYGVPARSLPPIRTWMMPKTLVFYYVILLLMNLFVEAELGTMLSTILLNGIPLLMAAFTVQAISFLLFVSHRKKKWTVLLPVLGIVAIPFLPQMVSLLGVLDVAFPLRKRMES
jgi:uncharacterized protein YybS (DUF2232 family)